MPVQGHPWNQTSDQWTQFDAEPFYFPEKKGVDKSTLTLISRINLLNFPVEIYLLNFMTKKVKTFGFYNILGCIPMPQSSIVGAHF